MTLNTSTLPEIEHPALWRLLLHLDDAELTVAMLNTASDASLHLLRFPLPDGPTLRTFEEIVYDNPILLSDFKKVDIITRSRQFVFAPAGIDAPAAEALASTYVPDTGSNITFESYISTPADDLLELWAFPDIDVLNFLGRTFSTRKHHHHLESLVAYFGRSNALGNSAKLYVNIHRPSDASAPRGQLDLIAFARGGKMQLANTIPFESIDDAADYIRAAARGAGLDLSADEILLGGDKALRADIIKVLSRFAASVMPIIFPAAALRFGPAATDAPLPLIFIPLCE